MCYTTTDFRQVSYEGKGYDVINDPGISDEEVLEQIYLHSLVILLIIT